MMQLQHHSPLVGVSSWAQLQGCRKPERYRDAIAGRQTQCMFAVDRNTAQRVRVLL